MQTESKWHSTQSTCFERIVTSFGFDGWLLNTSFLTDKDNGSCSTLKVTTLLIVTVLNSSKWFILFYFLLIHTTK